MSSQLLTSTWNTFRSSKLWPLLRQVGFLRSGLHLAIQLRRTLQESASIRSGGEEAFEQVDPYRYETNPLEWERFAEQARLLDSIRQSKKFAHALEIGCAEGVFTEILFERCERLDVFDISPTALKRTQHRCQWPASVHFARFDLLKDELQPKYDLIVVAAVFEYFTRRSTFAAAREKLVDGLENGGYLLIETTKCHPVVEQAWWGRYLIRGSWINRYIEVHPALTVVAKVDLKFYAISVCRKTQRAVSR